VTSATPDTPAIQEATFADLRLSEGMLKTLADLGYEAPTPIQERTIRPLIEGRDVIAQAQTGTGKTAAFAIPIVDEGTWQAAWEEGRAMGMEQAIAYALEEIHETERLTGTRTAPAPRDVYPNELTRREVEVLRLVAEGHYNAQIAERLFLSPNTVRAHLYSIYGKLDVTSRTAAALFAREHQLL
jgi:DNA-binding CsgD family transcriptional regulator